MSSEAEFFDILYLGVFAILSTAFDGRFYLGQTPSTSLFAEIAHAVGHFHALLHTFALRFIIVLGGAPVALSYVVDRLLAEFAAASVVFANAAEEAYGESCDDKSQSRVTPPMFRMQIEGILKESHPDVFFYYSRCLERRHSHFTWTGPDPQILPRSEDFLSIIPLATMGETLDHPAAPIYLVELDSPPTATTAAAALSSKRPGLGDCHGSAGGEAKKLRTQS
jgi:hypothetical protein